MSDVPATRIVLLVGRRADIIDDVRRHLDISGVQLIGATSIDHVRSALAQTNIDHVIMGAGIDLETRLQIVREIFQSSDTTTVHMKDRATGPDGFLSFIASLLGALT